jgi:putative membrane protein
MPSRKERESAKGVRRLYTTGFLMGMADLVPGVSGGTVAFIAGIYEELLYSIKAVTGRVVSLLVQRRFREAVATVPFHFLAPLLAGIFTAVFLLANLLQYLLQQHATFVWSLFLGMIVASILIVRQRVNVWRSSNVMALIASAIVTYLLVGTVPVETPNTLLALFVSGAIAISAMILPGISGSFLLVIMGKYEQVLAAVVARDLLSLTVFGIGCIVGLALFARLLSWLFTHHHDRMVAVLIGMMIGSLRKIWPWREAVVTRVNRHGEVVPVVERNILPEHFDGAVVGALLLALLGAAIVLYLGRVHALKERSEDIDDPHFKREHKEALALERAAAAEDRQV